MSRRNFIKTASMVTGIVSLNRYGHPESSKESKPKSIVCMGGHPDDPESMAGGTLAKFTSLGHQVSIIYLTTGEAGIPGKSHQQAASIRKMEALKASEILKCKAIFAGQIDGDTILNNEWVNKIRILLESLKPDIVITHWPLDTHKDHQVASLLTFQSWIKMKNSFDLYFGEVCTGEQTMDFHPTDYVDITDVQEIKRKAVYCHTSQDPAGMYACGHAITEEFRGRELGVKAAEAFVRMNGKGKGGFVII